MLFALFCFKSDCGSAGAFAQKPAVSTADPKRVSMWHKKRRIPNPGLFEVKAMIMMKNGDLQ